MYNLASYRRFLATLTIVILLGVSFSYLNPGENDPAGNNSVEASFGAETVGVNREEGEINLTTSLSSPNSCHSIHIDEAIYNESEDAVIVTTATKNECSDDVAAPSVINPPIPRMIAIKTTEEFPENVYVDHFERKEYNVTDIAEK